MCVKGLRVWSGQERAQSENKLEWHHYRRIATATKPCCTGASCKTLAINVLIIMLSQVLQNDGDNLPEDSF